jgi:hypothetical protein
MTLAAIGPDGTRHSFADTASFMAWFSAYPHRSGVLRVLNADPDLSSTAPSVSLPAAGGAVVLDS